MNVPPERREELAGSDVPVAIQPRPLLPAVRPSRIFRYSGLLNALSPTRAGTKRVSLSQPSRIGSTNRFRYQAWPIPPGFVVE